MAKRKADKPLELKYMPIKALRPWADNPRDNDAAVAGLVRSIEAFGYTNPILVRRANKEIIAGHTRVKALQQVGETHVPVILLDLTEEQAHAYSIADNKLTENTPWDLPKLADVMAGLQERGVDLELTGFAGAEVSELLAGDYIPDPADDEVPEPPKKAVTKPGDLWVLGEHRLLCGDATDKTVAVRVAAGVRVDLVITSPPYNVNIKYASYKDKASRIEYLGFIEKVGQAAFEVLAPGRFLVWNTGVRPSTYHNWQVVTLENVGFTFYRQIIWVKAGVPYPIFPSTLRARLARHYKPNYKHEVIAFLDKPSTGSAVEQCPTCEGRGSVILEPLPLDESHEVCSLMTKGDEPELGETIRPDRKYQNDVWHISQSLATVDLQTVGRKSDGLIKGRKCSHMVKEHPAAYPVELPVAAMLFLTAGGETAYDPFLGSGSTMIAAEKLGRRCVGTELDAGYCDVIVERWQTFTGQKARRERA